MTRDDAIAKLRECPTCERWITTNDCDHCWVDRHVCPPTVEAAIPLLKRASEIGREAEQIRAKLQPMLARA